MLYSVRVCRSVYGTRQCTGMRVNSVSVCRSKVPARV